MIHAASEPVVYNTKVSAKAEKSAGTSPPILKQNTAEITDETATAKGAFIFLSCEYMIPLNNSSSDMAGNIT